MKFFLGVLVSATLFDASIRPYLTDAKLPIDTTELPVPTPGFAMDGCKDLRSYYN